jgi:hypothetical protein
MKLVAGTQREIPCLSNKDKEKWVKDYAARETAAARQRVDDGETATKHGQEDMSNAEKAALTTTKPEMTIEQMLNAIGDTLGDHAHSDNRKDGDHQDDHKQDPQLGKLSEDDKPSWVIGTLSKTVPLAQCKSVSTQHIILPDTPGDLTSASKYFEMRPDPPRATKSSLRLCKSILKCSEI